MRIIDGISLYIQINEYIRKNKPTWVKEIIYKIIEKVYWKPIGPIWESYIIKL
jgi:hypothetical protein